MDQFRPLFAYFPPFHISIKLTKRSVDFVLGIVTEKIFSSKANINLSFFSKHDSV